MKSPMDALFAAADLSCTICGIKQSVGCSCWEKCSCGWLSERGKFCRNPETQRCSLKNKYGAYNRKTRRVEPKPGHEPDPMPRAVLGGKLPPGIGGLE